MVNAYIAPTLSAALAQFRDIIASAARVGGKSSENVVVFCEDRLSLAAEKAVCEAVGGSFSVSVYTLSRFLSAERGRAENVLTSQGSAMALRSIIDKNAQKLNLFKKLSATGAAQEVYDTIALLYSSGVSAEDISAVEAQGELLRRKLADLSLLYSEYVAYLRENGLVDRNEYLRQLPDVISSSAGIASSHVIILGFQAFTSSVRECVRACINTAAHVSGLFIGGRESLYVNQAWSSFVGVAAECRKPANIVSLPSDRRGAAEHLRRNLFDSLAFHRAEVKDTADVRLNVAADEAEECSFIAAETLRCVQELGLRYREISVMLPDLSGYQPLLERAFRQYGIPLYVDRRYPLISHPLCQFLLNYLGCLADGCRLQSVVQVVSSPVFLAAAGEEGRADKDVFINYLLRAASSRGGVKREINRQICEEPDLSYASVSRMRALFLEGLSLLSQAKGAELVGALKALADRFTAQNALEEAAKDGAFSAYPSVAAMNARAYECTVGVLDEAQRLAVGQKLSVRKLSALLKSGFTAAEISLIPPKQDAVFVGDLAATANTGSKVLFAAGLTDSVPACSQDIAILTDAELNSLDRLNLAVSPKISEVNDRVRETTALNLCAFSSRLYLVFPMRKGGEECARSEVADYALRLFSSGGKPLTPSPCDFGSGNFGQYPYYFARPLPALRRLAEYRSGSASSPSAARTTPVEKYSAVYGALKSYAESTGDEYIGAALKEMQDDDGHKYSLTSGRKLYGKSLSPTALESYFSCPYKCFMAQGLKLAERVEGALRPLDSGNFIHSVLEKTAGSLDRFASEQDCADFASGAAEELLSKPQYAAMSGDKRGIYTAKALSEEAVKVSVGAYRQLANSRFKVSATEFGCRIPLGEISLWGRIDRVDSCDDLVRIIDYKTGATDDSASSYYMGLKTQLPLYLLAASEGKRAAGAYYFPAKVEYSSSDTSAFCLQGFMDGSPDVVKCSDINVQEKAKSAYVNAYLNGRKLDKAMEREQFADFLDYAVMVSGGGAGEMLGGNIAPSPVQDACSYCKFGGCCGYDLKKSGERQIVKVDCRRIAEISRQCKEGKEHE